MTRPRNTKPSVSAQPDDKPPPVVTNPIRIERCFNCFYYREPDCRRTAPQATFTNEVQSRRAAFHLTWPKVGIDDWCGEYRNVEDLHRSNPP